MIQLLEIPTKAWEAWKKLVEGHDVDAATSFSEALVTAIKWAKDTGLSQAAATFKASAREVVEVSIEIEEPDLEFVKIIAGRNSKTLGLAATSLVLAYDIEMREVGMGGKVRRGEGFEEPIGFRYGNLEVDPTIIKRLLGRREN